MSLRTPPRLVLASAALLALPAAGAVDSSSKTSLDSLRLLPPVLLKGEEGWSLAERMRHYKVEAVSVALIRDYKVVWEAAVGLADREAGQKATAETLFQAGSISKPVTAAALLREAQNGTFRLDVDVNEYLRSWKLPANELTTRERRSPAFRSCWTARRLRTRRRCEWISCRARSGVTRGAATRSRSWR